LTRLLSTLLHNPGILPKVKDLGHPGRLALDNGRRQFVAGKVFLYFSRLTRALFSQVYLTLQKIGKLDSLRLE
jgi:hypothetical protein